MPPPGAPAGAASSLEQPAANSAVDNVSTTRERCMQTSGEGFLNCAVYHSPTAPTVPEVVWASAGKREQPG